MISVESLSLEVRRAIISNLGWEPIEDESPYLNQLQEMSVEEAFDCYCTWYGLIDFSGMLSNALDELRGAES